MTGKSFAFFSERFQPEAKLPDLRIKPSNVTFDDSDTFLTSTNIDSNIHRVHDKFMMRLEYLAPIKQELDLNYKIAVKNHDLHKKGNAINNDIIN